MSQFDDFDTQHDDGFDDEPQSMSLMGGIAGSNALPGPDGFGVDEAGETKRISQQSMLIGLIVSVVAFGTLAGLRLTQSGAEASTVSAETQQFMDSLEIQIANLDKMDRNNPLHPDQIRETFRDTAAIVAAIENDPTTKQVPLTQVQMNPFLPIKAEAKPVVVEVDNSEELRAAKLQSLYGELARIEVQSLIGGGRARAFLSGELYKVGDAVGSFRIVSIDNRKVVFEVPGFVLRAGETAFALGLNRQR
jgi:hypothetical protein